ncbi:uncharacterized protein TEOVI_000109600 [Trypanosoma equiperdum]|uniref:Uncharacterized protein n=1 Tax=Trypanosoma equiperdum TaxID=5694 RepID=A0A1G4IBP2_TRYEQ|nr:hypothetical protein TEOVI_000109600 [Trypanosoma equiperdum]
MAKYATKPPQQAPPVPQLQLMALFLGMTTWHIAADDFAAETAKVTHICNERDYLHQLYVNLKGKSEATSAAIADLRFLRRLWRLHAEAATDRRQQCLLDALANMAEDQETALSQTVKAITEKTQPALDELQQQLGRIEAAAKAASFNLIDSTESHPDGSGGTATTLYFKLNTGSTLGCSLAKDPAAETFSNKGIKPEKITNLKLTDIEKIQHNIKELKMALTASSGCPQSGQRTTNQARLGSCTFGGAANPQYGRESADTAQAQTQTTIFSENTRQSKCNDVHKKQATAQTGLDKLAAALCVALKAGPTPDVSMRTKTGKELATTHSIQLNIRNCDPAFHELNEPNSNDANKELVDYITKAYGENANDFVTRFITKLEAANVMSRSGKTPEHKKISDLSTSSSMAAALSYLRGQRNKKELEAEKKNTVATLRKQFFCDL